jgi:hypothetical protein
MMFIFVLVSSLVRICLSSLRMEDRDGLARFKERMLHGSNAYCALHH